MKKILLLTLLIALFLPIEIMAQANVIHTTKFKLRTIKKGYTGDWAGSQTDTTGNQGLNYNALKEEILWGRILNADFTFTSSYQDSLKAIIGRVGFTATAPITLTTLVATGASTLNSLNVTNIPAFPMCDGIYIDSSMTSINDTLDWQPFFNRAVVLDSIKIKARGAACNFTALLWYGTGANTPTAIKTAGFITTSLTTGNVTTSFNNGTIPANNMMFVGSTSLTTKPKGWGITRYYH